MSHCKHTPIEDEMSRTLKDRPAWVRANDKSEPVIIQHNHLAAGTTRGGYKGIADSILVFADECTEDVPSKYRTSFDQNEVNPCGRSLSWQVKRPQWAERNNLRANYWKPERAQERTVLRRIEGEYSLNGEIDEDYLFPLWHRRSGLAHRWGGPR